MGKDNKTYTRSKKSAQNAKPAENWRPVCVFGILDTPKGLQIAEEMLQWLRPVYEVIEVHHDGKAFELPALLRAQFESCQRGEPVLYIHTRGAVNEWRTTVPTRKMWAEEFGRQWRKYFTLAECPDPLVLCPFRDYDNETRYNGFVANPAAWDMLDLEPTTDRMDYERLWRNKPCVVLGLLINREDWAIKDIRKYLYNNYE